jgi:hypothetical protein
LGLKLNGRSGGWENYTVRLVATGQSTFAAGTGILSSSFQCDPSASSLSEWSTFAALFDEVKCVGFEVWLAPIDDSSTLTQSYGFNVGSFTRTVSAPASAAAVAVAPDSVLLNPQNTSALAYCHRMKYPKDILYAPTSSPTPGPYAGCPGSIQVYGVGTPSAGALNYVIVGRYALRGRL